MGLSKTTDFGVELRCCVGSLGSKVFVEGKKGNVVTEVLREELSNKRKEYLESFQMFIFKEAREILIQRVY